MLTTLWFNHADVTQSVEGVGRPKNLQFIKILGSRQKGRRVIKNPGSQSTLQVDDLGSIVWKVSG